MSALQVGDVVALTCNLPARQRWLKAGARGQVLLADAAWGMVTVAFDAQRSRPILLRPQHLQVIGHITPHGDDDEDDA
jgi:hypothetical protein